MITGVELRQLLAAEYAYWRDQDGGGADADGIRIGAMGAVANVMAATCGRPAPWHPEVANPNAAEDLLMKLARHIRNTDTTPPLAWGVAGGNLLAEVRALNPARYDAEVK